MLNPLDDRYLGSVCEIRTFGNDILAIGTVFGLGEDYIRIRARDGEMMLLSTGAKVKLNIFNSKAGFTVLICEVLTSTKREIKVVEPLRIIDHERRRGFRVEVDLTGRVSYKNDFSKDAPTNSLHVIWIKDLSICGLRMYSQRPYILGQVVWMNLDLEGISLVTKAQIIRMGDDVIENKDGEQLREYGVKLLFDREDDNDRLCSYLFKRQREISQRVK